MFLSNALSPSNETARPKRGRARRRRSVIGAALLLIAGPLLIADHAAPALSAGTKAPGGAVNGPADVAGGPVDMALALAVDVSDSVDDERFTLQMDGVAAAFESVAVQKAILSGPRRSILVAFVQWSNKPTLSLPWTRLSSAADVRALAMRIRMMRRTGGDFTCMSRMMQYVEDKLLPLAPAPAGRTVLDISGDGQDNCNDARPVDAARDALIGSGATVNGLPIVARGGDRSLERWFADHVVGGEQAFVLPAFGYDDFGRAIQQKLVSEISGLRVPAPGGRSAAAAPRRP